MYDYMKALQQKFYISSEEEGRLCSQIENLRTELISHLAKPERRILLRLLDLEDALQDHVSLRSFIAGYSLAEKINRELSCQPPYSFAVEEERRAKELLRKGREQNCESTET